MRKQEKRLGVVLAGLVLLGGGVILWDLYRDRKSDLRAEEQLLEDEWIEIETLLEEKDKWEMRKEWLDRNQPAFTSGELVSQAIFKEAQAAGEPRVATSRHKLLRVEKTPFANQAGVSFTASGSLPDVLAWLHQLTPPESFRLLRNVQLSPDEEDRENVKLQVELLRWYAPSS